MDIKIRRMEIALRSAKECVESNRRHLESAGRRAVIGTSQVLDDIENVLSETTDHRIANDAARAHSPRELVRRVREYERDHEPHGWPAVQMHCLSDMADAIESLLPQPRKYPRTKCPGCGQEHAVVDGRVWNHIINAAQCPGAGGTAPSSAASTKVQVQRAKSGPRLLKLYVQSQQTKAAINGGVSTHKL